MTNVTDIVNNINKALPAIEQLVAAFDPMAAGAVTTADALINAGVAMAAKKAAVDPALWAAQSAVYNQEVADIMAAEAGVVGD